MSANILSFQHADLKRLVEDARRCWPTGIRRLYDEAEPKRGFWLVGDHGVYLMHNGLNDGPPAFVAYADECNPEKLPFDEWWEAKRATFGGDDGAEYIEPGLIEKVADSPGSLIQIRCTENEIGITAVVEAAE